MAPLPKKKHSHSRTHIRRGKKKITLKELFAHYSRAKGLKSA